MSDLIGTATLVRAVVRRDRARIAIWTVGIAALVVLTAASVKDFYPTQAELDRAAETNENSPAAIAFNGPPLALDTVGGQVAFQVGSFGLSVAGLMSLLLVTRNTRAEEESGRMELVRSLVVGRHAPSTAALVIVAGMNVLVGAVVALGLVSQDLPVAGSVAFGACFTALGAVFAGIAAVTAQVTENSRVANGLAGAVLGLAYVARAIGDTGDGTLSWFSPIGLVQKARPYAGERWWPLLIALGLAGGLVMAAAAIASRRDIAAGLVQPRPGPAVAGRALSGPVGLALRLQRGGLVAWAGGVFLLGAAYGSIGNDIEDFVDDSEALRDVVTRAGGGSVTDAFYSTSVLMLALIGAGYAIQSAQRLRSEETTERAEPVLATPISRWRWATSHLVLAVAGTVLVLAAGGFGTGLLFGIVSDDLGQIPRLLGAGLVYAPAVGVLVGLTIALFGLVPRAVVAAWGVLAFCFVIGLLGQTLDLPTWVVDVSPFERTPQLPAGDMAVVPLAVLTATAAALTCVGLAAFRQRDMG